MKKVFLSSTSRDLANYRQAVYDAIESLQGYHCVRMENFGARAAAALQFDSAIVADCDLYIAIIGKRHGSGPDDSEKSFTELEYEAAVEMGKPCLMFLSSPDLKLNPESLEPPEKQQRQERFRRRVAGELICGFFASPLELSGQAIIAVFNWEREHSDIKQTIDSKWLAVPRLPSPYFAHPYPLQDHFTGRLNERNKLSTWLVESDQSLLSLIGIGGMGKSALTWVWLHKDVLRQDLPGVVDVEMGQRLPQVLPEDRQLEGSLWWSFYEADATFPAFIDEALVYITGGVYRPERIPSTYNKARTLFALLQQRCLLIIFDGFERLLQAYAGMSGGYRTDGPMEESLNNPHACVDPLVSRFLLWVASSRMKSRILITSRLFPKELEGFGSLPLPGCRREELDSMTPDEAVIFFHSTGVKGTRYEIKKACEPYGYHALTLRLLSGYIVNHFARPGEIEVALKYNPLQKLIPRKHNILALAYNALNSREQQLLSYLAAFRSPMDYASVKALSEFATDEELNEALEILVRRGLIFFDRERVRFDLHPVVRRYAYERLADKQGIHNRLRDYFTAIPLPKGGRVRGIEELSPTIELFHHTVRAGLYKEAFQLYQERLRDDLDRLGAFITEIDILEVFLEEGRDGDRLYLKDMNDQTTVLNTLGVAYGYIGKIRQGLDLFRKSLAVQSNAKKTDKAFICNARSNISYFQMRLGNLEEAEEEQRYTMALAAEIHDAGNQAYGHMRLGLILSFTGRYAMALEEFCEAIKGFRRSGEIAGQCHLWAYRVIRARLVGEYGLALVCARRALNLSFRSGDQRLVTRAKNLLASALLDKAKEDDGLRTRYLSQSETLLIEALRDCRKLDLVDVEVNVLLNWARWHQMKGDLTQVEEEAKEALAIASRCEYRLEQADSYNLLAALSLARGDKARAHKYAEAGRASAWCTGTIQHYISALQEANRLLTDINV